MNTTQTAAFLTEADHSHEHDEHDTHAGETHEEHSEHEEIHEEEGHEEHAGESPAEHAEHAETGGHAHGEGGGFWDEYLYLLTDPAHIFFEITMSLAFDVLVVYLGYQLFVKRYIIPKLRKQIHAEIDQSHNVTHDENGDHVEHQEAPKK